MTANKKQLIDFLWEWAGNSEWAKLLTFTVVTKGVGLDVSERQEVFSYFLQEIGLTKGLTPIKLNKPTYAPSRKEVALTSISNIKGVNKLSDAQSIPFAKNVTIFYGENGSGKTGYGRILKALGHSYDINTLIHGNIDGNQVSKAAEIEYTDGVGSSKFIWDGQRSNPELSNIAVFNNNCVSVSLAENRTLLVSPIGFHLFNIMTDELGHLSNMLQSEFDKYPRELSWAISLHPGTPQEQFITNLKGNSNAATLEKLASFTAEHEKQLSEKNADLANLNKSLLEAELKTLQLQINEISNSISKVEQVKSIINQDAVNEYYQNIQKIKELDGRTVLGLKEIAETNGIALYNTPEFKYFIQAADNYLKNIEKPDYPTSADKCLYCNQQLIDENSIKLLKAYRTLLNDTTQDALKEIAAKQNQLTGRIIKTDHQIVFLQPIFGAEESGKPVQPELIVNYNAHIENLKKSLLEKRLENDKFSDVYEDVIIFLRDKEKTLIESANAKKDILANIGKQEQQLITVINELLDRKFISEKVTEIKAAIVNRGIVKKLVDNKGQFNTNSLSRKTTEAREELISQNFNDLFQQELKALRKTNISIDLNFGTSKGTSKLQQKMKARYSLAEILSEGEQKAIALAEFLTELQLDNSKGPVVFDDPVNSLDHHIIDDFARRMVKMSAGRQIVIFTHSVLLLNSFLHECGLAHNKSLDCKFYDVKSEYGVTGIITENQAEKTKIKAYTGEIKNLIQNAKSSGRSESVVASEGFGILRSAIEIAVEHLIFRGTVKRYQKNIALTLFIQVNGSKVDQHKAALNEIYERCCGYTNAHSNPELVIGEPKLDELQFDLNSFDKILLDFKEN